MARLAASVSRHPLLYFFILAFAISWPAFAVYGSGAPPSSQFLLLIVGSCAPAIAALAISSATRDRPSLRQRITRWRVARVWYIISFILPTATWLVSALATSALSGSVQPAPGSLVFVPVILATSFVEEVGWRRFATAPRSPLVHRRRWREPARLSRSLSGKPSYAWPDVF